MYFVSVFVLRILNLGNGVNEKTSDFREDRVQVSHKAFKISHIFETFLMLKC